MYGIGYTYSGTNQFSIGTNSGAANNQWGMYVCDNGTARIFLSGSNGVMYGIASTARYADLAEMYVSDEKYEPGTVMVFGGSAEVTIATQSHSTRIAGVISTNPGYLMNNKYEKDGAEVALVGRVPCKVQGPVEPGDLMVAGTKPGYAMRLDPLQYSPGCVIGKALEPFQGDEGIIEVVVGRL
jgi:hypothetical protein